MIREIYTIEEATREWVRGMNAIPYELIHKIVETDIDSLREVTVPSRGDCVYVYNLPETDMNGAEYDANDGCGEIIGYDNIAEEYAVELNNGAIIKCVADDFEVKRNSFLPMWNTLWTFGDSSDEWLTFDDGIRKMSECGFRIYESDDFGYFFGIDGTGYSFYEKHWIPLYKARGLQWHDTDEE